MRWHEAARGATRSAAARPRLGSGPPRGRPASASQPAAPDASGHHLPLAILARPASCACAVSRMRLACGQDSYCSFGQRQSHAQISTVVEIRQGVQVLFLSQATASTFGTAIVGWNLSGRVPTANSPCNAAQGHYFCK